jgi:hypothetical protein
MQMVGHSLADQLDGFRKLAAEAHSGVASATSPEMKAGYEHLANSWDKLIGEIEAAMGLDKRSEARW